MHNFDSYFNLLLTKKTLLEAQKLVAHRRPYCSFVSTSRKDLKRKPLEVSTERFLTLIAGKEYRRIIICIARERSR